MENPLLKFIFNELTEKMVDDAFNSPNEYISLKFEKMKEASVISIDAVKYSEPEQEEHTNHGNLYCTKDVFRYLYTATGATNQFLDKWL